MQRMYDRFTAYMEQNEAESSSRTSSVRGRRIVNSADVHREQGATDSNQQDQPPGRLKSVVVKSSKARSNNCLLYTSDAADE